MKKTIFFLLIVVMTVIFVSCGNTEPNIITDVPSETRELLKDECEKVLRENNVTVNKSIISASVRAGECYLYFNDFRIHSEYENLLVAALSSPEYAEEQLAQEVILKSDFRFENNEIIMDYMSPLKSKFEEAKKEVILVDSKIKEIFKEELIEFLESEGTEIVDAYIKIEDGRINLISIAREEPIYTWFSIHRINNYYINIYNNMGNDIVNAIINGDNSIKLPNFEYSIENGYKFQINVK